MWIYTRKIGEVYRNGSHEIYFELQLQGSYPTGGIAFDKSHFGLSLGTALMMLSFFYHPQYYLFWDSESTPQKIVVADRATLQELANNTNINIKVRGKVIGVAR